jgi:uncharacterized protein YdhG (YjbR/CyaY superfamily)
MSQARQNHTHMPDPQRPRFDTVDAYMAAVDPRVRATLQAIRSTVAQAVPGATECISYQMPALRRGRVFLYFAAFRKHVGVYPPLQDPAFDAELAPYRGPKGNLQFPLDAPIPLVLIARVAAGLARQYAPEP